MLFLWLILFAITTGAFASRFGVPQQFLMPEYMGKTDFVSFGIVGFALGGFIIAFNLYTYILHGYRFPFIATVSRPFQKFTFNNFILPAIFLVTYIFCSVHFQKTKEYVPSDKILFNVIGLIAGMVLFMAIAFGYFLYTNKTAESYNGNKKRRRRRKKTDAELSPTGTIPSTNTRLGKWHVETYLYHFWKIKLARESSHYSKPILDKVLAQNHINASLFEIALVISFFIIGSLRENEYFIIPAAASALLFFTMILMIASAVFSWIKGWTTTIMIAVLLLVNFFYTDLHLTVFENYAYGLSYNSPRAPYPAMNHLPNPSIVVDDITNTTAILEKWKQKNTSAVDSVKPKMIIINCSGGGSRSAFWTMRSLMHADEVSGNQLLDQTVMITGASGGMLGAAYLREIMLREKRNQFISRNDSLYCEDLALDLLNPVMQSIATNDWFFRFSHLEDGEYSYTKDRGFSFENQLNTNTRNLLTGRISDYVEPEKEALIPLMILSPSIVNDGRRLIISSQPSSYLALPYEWEGTSSQYSEDVEFLRAFSGQDALNLRITSALRMNATFPYILPAVSLPCDPPMEVMDAGIRDNFGLKTTLEFLYTFKDWISENTSGVVILQVRDLPKGVNLDGMNESLFGQFTAPLGSIYGNMTKTQDYNSFQMLQYLSEWFDDDIDLVTFQLPLTQENFVSLSWHLTENEKRTIRSATKDPQYVSELSRLCELLK